MRAISCKAKSDPPHTVKHCYCAVVSDSILFDPP